MPYTWYYEWYTAYTDTQYKNVSYTTIIAHFVVAVFHVFHDQNRSNFLETTSSRGQWFTTQIKALLHMKKTLQ